MRSADRPAGRPLLRGLLARAVGATEGTVRADAPRHGVRWTPAGVVEPAGAEAAWVEPAEAEPAGAGPEPVESVGREREPEPPAGASPAAPPGTPPGGTAPPAGLVAELRQLADLAREGLLTPEEFTTAKGRLLRG
ncbi:hypothetical protein ACFCZ1_13520 [Streptomyces sp. NPDC056224]|uniref:hypothetical protein n=1 Tax=Streptomyces sp. NPDC056224 TaxID=3345750 RepID=UPI0035D9255E